MAPLNRNNLELHHQMYLSVKPRTLCFEKLGILSHVGNIVNIFIILVVSNNLQIFCSHVLILYEYNVH